MKKRILSLFLSLCLFSSLVLGASAELYEFEYPPCPRVEYDMTEEVTVGTVRYVNQNLNSQYFYDEYWGDYVDQAHQECGTSSISMALSYVGIDAEPSVLADYWGGQGGAFSTNFGNVPGVTSVSSGDFFAAFDRYVNGQGKYSPVIIHLNQYSSRGHFVIVVGKMEDNLYLVIDPFNSNLWSIAITKNADGTLTLCYPKRSGDVVETCTDDAVRGVGIYAYQYYNENAVLPAEQEDVYVCPYTDLAAGQEAAAVAYVSQLNLIDGASDTLFNPTGEVTRAELATTLYRMAGEPEVNPLDTFTDVAADDSSIAAISWANQNRLICGVGSNQFDPNGTVSRQQLMLVLYRYYTRYWGYEGVPLGSLKAYPDAELVSTSAKTAMEWAEGNSLISARADGFLWPDGHVTRSELAIIVANYCINL